MKRKKNPQGFHKRPGGAAANPSLLQSIRNTLQNGDYPGALAAINQAVANTTDSGGQSELFSLAGDCLFRQGKFAGGRPAPTPKWCNWWQTNLCSGCVRRWAKSTVC